MHIGAAKDMMVAGFDALAMMQAGGWKSTNVVLRTSRRQQRANSTTDGGHRLKVAERVSSLNSARDR
jgi:hypothetical protein